MKVEITKEQTYLFEIEREIELMEESLDLMKRQLQRAEQLYKHGVQVGATLSQRTKLQNSLHNMREVMAMTKANLLESYESYRMCRTRMEVAGIFSTMPVLVPFPT